MPGLKRGINADKFLAEPVEQHHPRPSQARPRRTRAPAADNPAASLVRAQSPRRGTIRSGPPARAQAGDRPVAVPCKGQTALAVHVENGDVLFAQSGKAFRAGRPDELPQRARPDHGQQIAQFLKRARLNEKIRHRGNAAAPTRRAEADGRNRSWPFLHFTLRQPFRAFHGPRHHRGFPRPEVGTTNRSS